MRSGVRLFAWCPLLAPIAVCRSLPAHEAQTWSGVGRVCWFVFAFQARRACSRAPARWPTRSSTISRG